MGRLGCTTTTTRQGSEGRIKKPGKVGLGWGVGAGWLGVGSGCGLVRGGEWVRVG